MAEGSQAGETGTSLPATWQGINRNTGKPIAGGNDAGDTSGANTHSSAAGGFNDDAGGDGSNNSKMTKAGGQPGSGGRRRGRSSLSESGKALSHINFPDEIGTPKQPNYMTFRCWKITSAVGGTMGDMNFDPAKSAGVSQVAQTKPEARAVCYARARRTAAGAGDRGSTRWR